MLVTKKKHESVQRCRSTLPSRVQPTLTGALTHHQNIFRKLDVNQLRFSMRYQNDLYDTHFIFELLACLTPGFQGHENVLSKENLELDLPKNYRTSFVSGSKPSSSSCTLCVLLIHLTEKHQHRPVLVSSSNSKFFLHNGEVIGLVK